MIELYLIVDRSHVQLELRKDTVSVENRICLADRFLSKQLLQAINSVLNTHQVLGKEIKQITVHEKEASYSVERTIKITTALLAEVWETDVVFTS